MIQYESKNLSKRQINCREREERFLVWKERMLFIGLNKHQDEKFHNL